MRQEMINKLLLFFLGFILCFILMNKCDDTNTYTFTKSKVDSLNLAYNTLNFKNDSLNIKLNNSYLTLDSLKLIKNKVIVSYKTKRVDVLTNLHDTIVVMQYVQACDSVISADSLVINQQDSLINDYKTLNANKNSMLANRNSVIENQIIDLNIAKSIIHKEKRTKLAVIFGSIGAIITTIFIMK